MGGWKWGEGGPFGRGPWGPDWRVEGGPGRARRGDIKYLLLEVLAERPRHGYDIIKDLEERRGGYRPSPGSVYPTLQMLEEGGYVTSEAVEGKKVYTITDAGRHLLDQRVPQEDEPNERHQQAHEVRESAMKLAHAVMQAVRAGDPRTLSHLKTIIDQARRDIYVLLAEDGA